MKNINLIGLFIFVLFHSYDGFSQDNMKILSYNVYKGFQADSTNEARYIKWVREKDPDIVAYQEMRGFTQKRLEEFARQYEHPYAVLAKTEGNPVALSSKYPIVNAQKVLDNMWHGYLYANIHNIYVFVVHFSASYYSKRAEELRTILAHAATLPQEDKILIMGDFNALDRSDAEQYGSELLKNMQDRDKKYNQVNLNDGNLDYSVMDQMTAAGYIDAYRLRNNQYRHTLPTKKHLTRATRRIDYIWANPVMAKDIKKSTIIHDQNTDEMSDHYPMYIETISQ